MIKYESTCGISTGMEMETEYKTPGWSIAFFIIVVLFLVSAIGCTVIVRKRKINYT